MSTQQQYDAFVVEAFTEYRIPNQITMMAKDWICKDFRFQMPSMGGKKGHFVADVGDDLGYGELGMITDYVVGMRGFSQMHSLDKWKTCAKSMKQEHRIGKGAYRTLLKLFYLYTLK